MCLRRRSRCSAESLPFRFFNILLYSIVQIHIQNSGVSLNLTSNLLLVIYSTYVHSALYMYNTSTTIDHSIIRANIPYMLQYECPYEYI